MSESEYFYSRDRQTREGPVPFAELRDLARRGILRREHLVWTDGMGEWVGAGAVPGIFGDGPPPIPPTVPGPVGGEDVWEEPVYAGFWLRFLAAIIDGLVLLIPNWAVNLTVGGMLGVPVLNTMQSVNTGAAVLYFVVSGSINLGIGWLYFALMESSGQQATLGKLALGLRVTTESLERLTFGRATGRYFGKMLSNLTLYIGYIMAGFTERKQALHDIVAGCLVIRKR